MLVVLEKIQQFKSKFSVDQLHQFAVSAMIFVILLCALFAILSPVSKRQMQGIDYLAMQQSHPESQQVALQLIAQSEISVGQYLKLMHIYQYEQQRAQQLPPLVSEGK